MTTSAYAPKEALFTNVRPPMMPRSTRNSSAGEGIKAGGGVLGNAAAAKPPLIPFNPAVRPRNRGRRTDRSPQRAWATPLEVLLVAKRAALLAGRDDEFTMMVTIGYTGMRWGETIGLERDLLLPALINAEWQLREISGRFHRLLPKDDSYRSCCSAGCSSRRPATG